MQFILSKLKPINLLNVFASLALLFIVFSFNTNTVSAAYSFPEGEDCSTAANIGGTALEDECFVLLEIYDATNGDYWLEPEYWGSDTPVCNWHGITCNFDESEILELNLPNNNLNGTLPDVFDGLSSLISINLSGNLLTGELPLSLQSLTSLQTFNISNNSLEGTYNVYQNSLTTINFSSNNFSNIEESFLFSSIFSNTPQNINYDQNKLCYYSPGYTVSESIKNNFNEKYGPSWIIDSSQDCLVELVLNVNTTGETLDDTDNYVCDVDNETSGDQCTISEAVRIVNNASTADLYYKITVNIDAGLYDLTKVQSISASVPVEFIGAGLNETTITIEKPIQGDYVLFDVDSLRNVSFKNLKLSDSTNPGGAAMMISANSPLHIDGVDFSHGDQSYTNQDGIYLESGSIGSLIENSYFYGTQYGIRAVNTEVTIDNNIFGFSPDDVYHTTQYPILMTDVSGDTAEVKNNYFACYTEAVSIGSSDLTSISGNTFGPNPDDIDKCGTASVDWGTGMSVEVFQAINPPGLSITEGSNNVFDNKFYNNQSSLSIGQSQNSGQAVGRLSIFNNEFTNYEGNYAITIYDAAHESINIGGQDVNDLGYNFPPNKFISNNNEKGAIGIAIGNSNPEISVGFNQYYQVAHPVVYFDSAEDYVDLYNNLDNENTQGYNYPIITEVDDSDFPNSVDLTFNNSAPTGTYDVFLSIKDTDENIYTVSKLSSVELAYNSTLNEITFDNIYDYNGYATAGTIKAFYLHLVANDTTSQFGCGYELRDGEVGLDSCINKVPSPERIPVSLANIEATITSDNSYSLKLNDSDYDQGISWSVQKLIDVEDGDSFYIYNLDTKQFELMQEDYYPYANSDVRLFSLSDLEAGIQIVDNTMPEGKSFFSREYLEWNSYNLIGYEPNDMGAIFGDIPNLHYGFYTIAPNYIRLTNSDYSATVTEFKNNGINYIEVSDYTKSFDEVEEDTLTAILNNNGEELNTVDLVEAENTGLFRGTFNTAALEVGNYSLSLEAEVNGKVIDSPLFKTTNLYNIELDVIEDKEGLTIASAPEISPVYSFTNTAEIADKEIIFEVSTDSSYSNIGSNGVSFLYKSNNFNFAEGTQVIVTAKAASEVYGEDAYTNHSVTAKYRDDATNIWKRFSFEQSDFTQVIGGEGGGGVQICGFPAPPCDPFVMMMSDDLPKFVNGDPVMPNGDPVLPGGGGGAAPGGPGECVPNPPFVLCSEEVEQLTFTKLNDLTFKVDNDSGALYNFNIADISLNYGLQTLVSNAYSFTVAAPVVPVEPEAPKENTGSTGSTGGTSPTPPNPVNPTTPVIPTAPTNPLLPSAPGGPTTPETPANPVVDPTDPNSEPVDDSDPTDNPTDSENDDDEDTSDTTGGTGSTQTPQTPTPTNPVNPTTPVNPEPTTEEEVRSDATPQEISEVTNSNYTPVSDKSKPEDIFDTIEADFLDLNQEPIIYSCNALLQNTADDKDSDADGCSDALERAFGTDPFRADILSCSSIIANNLSACQPIPVEVDEDAFLKLNLKGAPNTYNSPNFMIPGGVSLNTNVELQDDEVCFSARDKNTGRGFDFDLGCYNVDYLNDLDGFNYNRKVANFAFVNEKKILDGQYRLLAYAKATNGESVYDFKDIVIDSSADTIPLELVEFSGLTPEQLKSGVNLLDIVNSNGKVYAVFRTPINTGVEAYWNSVLLTSTVLADSSSGLTYVEVPKWFDLKSNELHKLSAYAYDLTDPSKISNLMTIRFRLGASYNWIFYLLAIFALMAIAGFFYRRNKLSNPPLILDTDAPQQAATPASAAQANPQSTSTYDFSTLD